MQGSAPTTAQDGTDDASVAEVTDTRAVPPAPGVRQRKPDRRRARTRASITAAARELFARQGVRATTIEEIAQAAGTSPGTVYFHFASKEGVLAATVEDAFTGLASELEGVRERPGGLERVLLGIELWFGFALEHPLAFGQLARGGSPGDPTPTWDGVDGPAATGARAFVTQARHDLEEAMRRGELRPIPVDEVVALVWGTCSGLAALAARVDDGLGITPEVARRALELGRRSLLAELGVAAHDAAVGS